MEYWLDRRSELFSETNGASAGAGELVNDPEALNFTLANEGKGSSACSR